MKDSKSHARQRISQLLLTLAMMLICGSNVPLLRPSEAAVQTVATGWSGHDAHLS